MKSLNLLPRESRVTEEYDFLSDRIPRLLHLRISTIPEACLASLSKNSGSVSNVSKKEFEILPSWPEKARYLSIDQLGVSLLMNLTFPKTFVSIDQNLSYSDAELCESRGLRNTMDLTGKLLLSEGA